MDISTAVDRLGALAQATRLGTFRALVQAGPQGLAAGALARELGVRHNTLSAHLNVLVGAGLLKARREGRSIIYRVDYDATRDLVAYLLEDCCRASGPGTAATLDFIGAGCCPAPH